MTVIPFVTAADLDAGVEPIRRHLEHDGAIAYPTETVYGLGCRPTADAVARLAALKGRRRDKPFLLLAGSTAMVRALQLDLSGYRRRLADALWPGPLTLVLSGGEGKLPDALRGPEGGIAVRVTSQPLVSRLVSRLGFPVTSTSANRPGSAPAPGAGGIVDAFGDAVQDGRLLVLDGGILGNVPPSTIVDCTGTIPRIIREGAVVRGTIDDVVAGRA